MAEELNRIMSTLVEAVTCTGNHHPCLAHTFRRNADRSFSRNFVVNWQHIGEATFIAFAITISMCMKLHSGCGGPPKIAQNVGVNTSAGVQGSACDPHLGLDTQL